jgi:hypothetical protein
VKTLVGKQKFKYTGLFRLRLDFFPEYGCCPVWVPKFRGYLVHAICTGRRLRARASRDAADASHVQEPVELSAGLSAPRTVSPAA